MPELPCPVHHWAKHAPTQPALHTDGRTLTYAELDRYVTGTAHRLRALGVQPGDPVAWYGPNHWHHPVLLWALLRLGAVACPLNARLPVAALPDRLRQVSARLLVADGVDPATQPVRCIAPEAVVGAAPAEATVPHLDLDRRATLVFTSGSTGRPKAVLHTWGNHYFSALGSQAVLPLRPGHRWVVVLPLYHVGGLAICVRCFLHGATVVLPDDPRQVAEACTAGATHISLVATQLQRLLEAEPDVSTLEALLLGGSALPPALIQAAHARQWPVHVSYGSTEMASQVATTPAGADLDTLFTAGRLLPHRTLRFSAQGEILVGGKTRFAGYLDETGLHAPFDSQGWFATGDRGYWDEDGRLVVQGRMDQMFISGGENIHPEEIEQALGRLEGVRRALVVPVPDATFGFRPVAFVEAEGTAWSPAHFSAALSGQLPGYKVPRLYLPWPADAPPALKPDRGFFRARALRHVSGDTV